MTAVPTAINNLLELLRADTELKADDVLIEDGPWIDRPDKPAIVVVGWVPEEGESVDWSATSSDLSAGQNQSFTLQGLVSYLDGDGDMVIARNKADALLEKLRGIISKNKRLGGAVNHTELNAVSASPDQSPDGAEWAIRWAITARVF